jgi:hypothetical protein
VEPTSEMTDTQFDAGRKKTREQWTLFDMLVEPAL